MGSSDLAVTTLPRSRTTSFRPQSTLLLTGQFVTQPGVECSDSACAPTAELSWEVGAYNLCVPPVERYVLPLWSGSPPDIVVHFYELYHAMTTTVPHTPIPNKFPFCGPFVFIKQPTADKFPQIRMVTSTSNPNGVILNIVKGYTGGLLVRISTYQRRKAGTATGCQSYLSLHMIDVQSLISYPPLPARLDGAPLDALPANSPQVPLLSVNGRGSSVYSCDFDFDQDVPMDQRSAFIQVDALTQLHGHFGMSVPSINDFVLPNAFHRSFHQIIDGEAYWNLTDPLYW